MRSTLSAAAVMVLLLAASLACGPTHAAAQTPPTLSVSVSDNEFTTRLGGSITFTSSVSNHGSSSTGPLIVNLNFVPLDAGTFVDPEDWSTDRTVEVEPIAAGGSSVHAWTAKSVVNGNVAAIVTVLPKSPTQAAVGSLAVSPAVAIHVVERRPVNPGNVLPVSIGVPVFLALAFTALQLMRSRTQ